MKDISITFSFSLVFEDKIIVLLDILWNFSSQNLRNTNKARYYLKITFIIKPHYKGSFKFYVDIKKNWPLSLPSLAIYVLMFFFYFFRNLGTSPHLLSDILCCEWPIRTSPLKIITMLKYLNLPSISSKRMSLQSFGRGSKIFKDLFGTVHFLPCLIGYQW